MNAKRFWSPFIPFSLISFFTWIILYVLRKKVWSPRDDELISGYLMSPIFSPPRHNLPIRSLNAAAAPTTIFWPKSVGVSSSNTRRERFQNTSLHKTIYIHVLPKVFDVHLNKNNRKHTSHNGGVHKNGFQAPLQERAMVFFFLLLRRYILLFSHLVTTWNSGKD